MNTRAVADALGIESKVLRRFIRSPQCSFTACGSGGRYEFTPDDIPRLSDELAGWLARTPNAAPTPKATRPARTRRASIPQRDRDAEVWAEEGPVELPNIRDPRVRAMVRAAAVAAERRLEEQLIAAGLHVTQLTHTVR